MLVEGPAGIGKTSLLRAAGDMATQAGFTELRARASELEHDFAYGCVRQLFEPIIAKATAAERQRLFGGAAGAVRPLLAAGAASPQSPAADTSCAVLHGVYWLVNNLAEDGPVVALVDDVQWSDAESMRFFNYLAPRLEGLAVAVIASTRGARVANPDLARLAGGPETTIVRPGSLSAGGTATMCTQRLGRRVADEFAAACREATGGNPFFLEAVLREVEEQQLATGAHGADVVYHLGPAAIAQAVLLRLSAASASTTDLVRAVAVLGDGASLAEAAAMAGLAVDEAATAADLLAAMTILEPGEPLQFLIPSSVRRSRPTSLRSSEPARTAELRPSSPPLLPARSASRPSSPRRRRGDPARRAVASRGRRVDRPWSPRRRPSGWGEPSSNRRHQSCVRTCLSSSGRPRCGRVPRRRRPIIWMRRSLSPPSRHCWRWQATSSPTPGRGSGSRTAPLPRWSR